MYILHAYICILSLHFAANLRPNDAILLHEERFRAEVVITPGGLAFATATACNRGGRVQAPRTGAATQEGLDTL